jgi:hypothetical protein
MLPASARESLTRHLADVQRLHARDLARGFGRVVVPFALERKFPNARPNGGGSSCFQRPRSSEIPDSGHRHGTTCMNP